MFNHYMGCGGTSWDQIPSSELYTSYDFAAPVSEFGLPEENYFKAKEINYFLKGFNLSSTDLTAEGSDVVTNETENTLARIRQDNLNGCKWLFIRNLNKEKIDFNLVDGNKVSVKPFDMKILPINLPLKACNVDFSGMSIFGKVEKADKEILLMLIENDNELKLSGFDKIEASFSVDKQGNQAVIKAEQLDDFSFCELIKGNKSTKIIFLTESTSDKAWILDNKILIGAEFLTDNLEKAAFSENVDIKVFDIDEEKTFDLAVPKEKDVPELSQWHCFNASPEIDIAYDYSNWDFLEEGKFHCVANEVYDDYIWYKGNFKGHIDEIEISAKHCYVIYLNGKQVFYHDCLVYEEGSEIPEKIAFNVDKKFLNEKGINELTILVQNLGFDRGFQNELKIPRGLMTFRTLPEKNIEWQIRGGLTPVIDEWIETNPENIEETSENSYLKLLYSTFEINNVNDTFNPLAIDVSDLPFEKADIFLNGNMIGRHWKNKSPQDLFYLPDGFLKDKNIICFVIWDVRPESFFEKGWESSDEYVKIKIRNIKSFRLFQMSEIINK